MKGPFRLIRSYDHIRNLEELPTRIEHGVQAARQSQATEFQERPLLYSA